MSRIQPEKIEIPLIHFQKADAIAQNAWPAFSENTDFFNRICRYCAIREGGASDSCG
jgi:hypothetical protein